MEYTMDTLHVDIVIYTTDHILKDLQIYKLEEYIYILSAEFYPDVYLSNAKNALNFIDMKTCKIIKHELGLKHNTYKPMNGTPYSEYYRFLKICYNNYKTYIDAKFKSFMLKSFTSP